LARTARTIGELFLEASRSAAHVPSLRVKEAGSAPPASKAALTPMLLVNMEFNFTRLDYSEV
jgi:hypothetical protein